MRLYSDVLSAAEINKFTGYHHNAITTWFSNEYFRYFKISNNYMIPKVCLLNFLISPHVLDSYRPAKKMVDLAKELASKSPLIKELHRYLSKVKKQRPPE